LVFGAWGDPVAPHKQALRIEVLLCFIRIFNFRTIRLDKIQDDLRIGMANQWL